MTFGNGVITSDEAKILIQNYCNLTLDGVDVSLTTPGTGMYAVSSNNGSTVVKGGSTITVNDGNYAMDSFTFGDYDGGNVFIEDAVINGDLEIANGGKMTVDGGTVNGNVKVYNYDYGEDENVDEQSFFTVNSGLVNGNVATSEKGQTSIAGGEVTGAVTVNIENGAAATIAGGVFGSIGENVTIDAAEVATITDKGVTKTVVGLGNINQVLETVSENAVVTVQEASEGAALEAPAGVTVKNESGAAIKVNGEDLKAGSEAVAKAPESEKPQTDPADKDKNNGKAEGAKAVQTGDSSNVMLWVVLAVAAVAAGFVILYLKRRHKK